MARKLLVMAMVLLALGVLVVTGVLPVGRAVGLYVTLPVGVVLLGMSLIWRMLERQEESAAGAAETQAASPDRAPDRSPGGGCGCGCGH
jgi:uncharacterized membrane protein YqjE